MKPKARKKKPYCAPTLTRLTPVQAKKLLADRKLCNEEEAVDFLNSLRQRPQSNGGDKKWKRLA